MNDFPTEGVELTHILVVKDLDKSISWYRDVLGAELVREYGGTSSVFNFQGSWILLVTGGGPTKDKPEVTFSALNNREEVSHAFTIRVPDCQSAYEILRSRGAEFITPPVDWGQEIRCFFYDPDDNLFEISAVN